MTSILQPVALHLLLLSACAPWSSSFGTLRCWYRYEGRCSQGRSGMRQGDGAEYVLLRERSPLPSRALWCGCRRVKHRGGCAVQDRVRSAGTGVGCREQERIERRWQGKDNRVSGDQLLLSDRAAAEGRRDGREGDGKGGLQRGSGRLDEEVLHSNPCCLPGVCMLGGVGLVDRACLFGKSVVVWSVVACRVRWFVECG